MSETFQVQGADQLARTLSAAGDDLRDLSAVNEEAGRYVTARARAAAPRRTGRLAASLRATVDKAAVSIESPLVYANPIHWGWKARNITAQPFLLDALATNEPAVLEMYERNNERVLDHVHGI